MKLSLRNAYLGPSPINEGKKKQKEEVVDAEIERQEEQQDSKYSLQALYLGEAPGAADAEDPTAADPKKEPVDKEPDYKEKDPSLTPGDKALMDAMETAIQQAINDSVTLEESVQKDDKEVLSEKPGVSAAGFAYEDKVIDALMKAKSGGNIKKGAGASSGGTDADMNIFGKIFNVEIKLNSGAQMGGGSVEYSKSGEAYLTLTLEEDTEALLLSAVQEKRNLLNKLLNFLSQQDPSNINGRAIKFPMSCTKNAWERAQQSKLLVNTVVPYTADFIAGHYAKKGIYYIQIGGAGLFYMKDNPANLPIPRLQGNINILIRTGRGQSRRLANGIRVISAGIRVQGRLLAKNSSPYTLDDPNSIQAMLDAIKNSKKTKN